MSKDQADREALLVKLQVVQHIIERCIQLYRNERETVEYLFLKANIEPNFTRIVWQRLERESPKFFYAYHLRMVLRDHIRIYNELYEKQVELVRRTGRSVPSSSNGSHMLSMHNDSGNQARQPAENVPSDGVPALQPTPVNMSVPENVLSTQNTIGQGMNDVMIESNSDGGFMNNLIEAPNTIGEAFAPHFTSTDYPMETSSFGQATHNLSPTANFSYDTSALDSYSLSAALQPSMQVHVNMSLPENMLFTQNSIGQGMNDVMIGLNSEGGFVFGSENNVTGLGEASVPPFTSGDPMLNQETSAFEQDFSDMTPYFSNDAGGEGYSRSTFLGYDDFSASDRIF
ncbi:hypothetical protein AAHA92_26789 [Salvia divinorum]|uniref:Uncharacterized protein n=1 Tax=Salvia divinorum TaxID=28513 RepID=A0ABD1G1L6_SALDI